VHKFESLLAFVQELILEILHGDTRVQWIQHATLIINIIELTKFQCWLHVLACLLTLVPIEQHVAIMHDVVMFNGWEFIQPNINALIEKWMPCDALWVQTSLYGDYVMKQRCNSKYWHHQK
jgi:hypothetical protein